MLITNARIITEHHIIPHGWLHISDHIIDALGEGDAPDFDENAYNAHGAILAPGFIDLHVHGAMGHELMDANADGLRAMAKFYAQRGVTSFLPTTLTASHEQIVAALNTVKEVMPDSGGATILGAHLEGPYLNIEKCGAQRPEHIRVASVNEATELLDLGVIRLLAIAPEIAGNQWLITECMRRGIAVSIAHTSATYEEAIAAFDMGITQSTHTYNAMTPLHHRKPGVVGAALSEPRVRCEIICDLQHVAAGAIRTLYFAKGNAGTMLITDSMSATGMPDGDYTLGAHHVTKRGDLVTLADGTLAGSAATYDFCVRNFMQVTGKTFEDIWQVTSLTPAQAIHQGHLRGSIAPGKIADLVLLDEKANVKMTVVGGKKVYEA